MTKPSLPATCLTCGTAVNDDFCPRCGQKVEDRRRPLRRLVMDSLGEILSIESRLLGSRAALSRLGLVLLFAASPAMAQQNVLDLRFLELDDSGERTYHNLIYSHTFGDSRWSFEVFWLFLPTLDDYDEKVAGVGYRAFEAGSASVSLIAYFTSAPDDEYFEPTLFAVDLEGKLTWSLFLLHYLPLGGDGIHQWLVDPIEFQYAVGGPVSIGASGYFYRPQGGSWLTKVGPKISIADPRGATELAVRAVNDSGGVEFQLRRIFAF